MIDNETLRVIRQRRSIRSFRDEQIREEELHAVLEAAMYAPNAGDQAWHFSVIQNRELLGRLNIAAKEAAVQLDIEGLKVIASNESYDSMYGAPTLIIVSGDENAPVPLDADCAAATQNLLLAAESLGLGACWIYFVLFVFMSPQGPEWRESLGIPQGYKPYYSAVLGYKKDAALDAAERKPNLVTYIR